uniref:Uncharacterized protein n=1 Tax=Anopheles funestus TaxID=62324 RepID=A0A182RBH8_ANOFN
METTEVTTQNSTAEVLRPTDRLMVFVVLGPPGPSPLWGVCVNTHHQNIDHRDGLIFLLQPVPPLKSTDKDWSAR